MVQTTAARDLDLQSGVVTSDLSRDWAMPMLNAHLFFLWPRYSQTEMIHLESVIVRNHRAAYSSRVSLEDPIRMNHSVA